MATCDNVPAPNDMFNFAQHIIDRNLSRPEKIAYIDDNGSLTYGELSQRIRAFAGGLLAAGVQPEQRILLIVNDCNDLPVAFLGAIYAGIVPVPVNTLLTGEDYQYLLANSRAKALVISGTILPVLEASVTNNNSELAAIVVSTPESAVQGNCKAFNDFINREPLTTPANTLADEPAFWLYSSGSTGKPKGTIHTHASPYWTAELYGRGVLGITESDVCFSAAKLFFAYGLGNALSFPLSVGATVVLMAERPTPEAVFKRWKDQQPTIYFGAPTGFAGMLASNDLPNKNEINLRLVSSAGEALPAELGERFSKQFGVDIIDGIGSTEMLHIYLSNRPGEVRYGTTGRPVPGYHIELRNNDGTLTAGGEPGDLYVRGPSAALMYWANREKSRETFCGQWTKSGDKYIRNADGTYTYAGRSDDMIKISGIYVSPFEVEAVLIEHNAVLEAAVIGVEDDQGLVKTKAFIVLKEGKTVAEGEIKAFVKSRLAPYKYPRLIEYLPELPKTATGKIQRFQLRAMEAAKKIPA